MKWAAAVSELGVPVGPPVHGVQGDGKKLDSHDERDGRRGRDRRHRDRCLEADTAVTACDTWRNLYDTMSTWLGLESPSYKCECLITSAEHHLEHTMGFLGSFF